MADNDDKKFPNSTEGIAGLLNINAHGKTGPVVSKANEEEEDTTEQAELSTAPETSDKFFADKTVQAPSNLPIADFPFDSQDHVEAVKTEDLVITKDVKAGSSKKESAPKTSIPFPKIEPAMDDGFSNIERNSQFDYTKPTGSAWRVIKKVLPFVVIFAIAIGLYFFYFSDFSFTKLLNSQTLKLESITNSNTNKEYEQLKKDSAADYAIWFNQFFTDVNDESISSMDADVSGNGLSNFEKYLLNLNPKVYSTRGGTGDGQSVLDGVNPWTGKTFTDKQKELVNKYINPELISNRITAAAITRGVTKYAQYVNPDSPYYIDPATLQQANSNGQIIVNPTQISTSTPANVPTNTQTTNNTSTTSTNNNLRPDETVDQTKTALLEIPANNISVPITWTQDVKDFEADLKKGVVHYPGTAMLGEVGTSYISGHSSGYLWDKSPYKQIFAGLGNVKDGTSFSITATQKNGNKVKYNYVVKGRGEYAANDQAQFVSTADSVVALSTCWPVGTTARRLVIFAKLTQTEKI